VNKLAFDARWEEKSADFLLDPHHTRAALLMSRVWVRNYPGQRRPLRFFADQNMNEEKFLTQCVVFSQSKMALVKTAEFSNCEMAAKTM
jgi:hypothetical protein